MANQPSQISSDVWHIDSDQAILSTPSLTASMDLLSPHLGLAQLAFQGDPITGFALGINSGTNSAASKLDLSDAFVRGSDLVATYTATNEQPFSLQIYWRAMVVKQGALLLDTILSLQTDLLESFPGFAIETKLPSITAWTLPNEEASTKEIALPYQQPADRTEGILLRPENSDWSYAEVTHSTDRGECTIERSKDKSLLIRRQLGGQFLEKGVIRSLRVRGIFLPRENDFEHSAQFFSAFKEAEPPLTV